MLLNLAGLETGAKGNAQSTSSTKTSFCKVENAHSQKFCISQLPEKCFPLSFRHCDCDLPPELAVLTESNSMNLLSLFDLRLQILHIGQDPSNLLCFSFCVTYML